MFETTDNIIVEKAGVKRRKSSQPVMPQKMEVDGNGQYDIYPSHALGTGKIFSGYDTLAEWIAGQRCIMIDGYSGVFWNEVQQCLQRHLERKNLKICWLDMSAFLKPAEAIEQLVAGFTGTPGSVWGTRFTGTLEDFFQMDKIATTRTGEHYDLVVAFGVGAALLNWDGPVVYLDLPKNEVQYRMRAGSVNNLGAAAPFAASEMYKRYYFVDWVVLNGHKKNILERITVAGDVQWKESVNWMLGKDLREGLKNISKHVFRVRPWFEPGVWGGQWMKKKIPALNASEVNYAWSFELIVPENGIVFESDGWLLELSFDFLMFQEYKAVLGKHAATFGYEFPIRFDFLDTWDGGDLSIQCHPSVEYIREQFGENITQDETYYILDCKDNAQVYLGFQEGIEPETFRHELIYSRDNNVELDVHKFVQSHAANKHDLFLIPNGTVHSAGANNLVLEISATPYIFTFKMYDWLRLDLNGEPRAINIEHAFNNLRFERQGKKVTEELISKTTLIDKGADWELYHVPTHQEHFYDVHRVEFNHEITIQNAEGCHVLMLVEGTAIEVKTNQAGPVKFHYAETFVIPAAANEYTIVNKGPGRAKVVKAFIKG